MSLRRLLFVVAIVPLCVALPAPSAAAASLHKQNQSWVFDDTSGASNTVTVSIDGATGELVITSVESFVYSDSSCTVTAGLPNSIRCPLASAFFLDVNLGDGDDVGSSLIASRVGAPIVVWNGGQGNDRITGGGNRDVFVSPEVDGADTYIGGGGIDTVNYSPRLGAVITRLDGAPGSGAPGENDTFGADIENVFGTDFGDVVTGNAGDNDLEGDGNLLNGDGGDTLIGLAGDDALRGYKGDDKLDGGAGDDLLYGDDGNDTARGGPGNDVFHGMTGNDQLFGDAGADVLNGEGGNDTLVGGPGKDRFVAGSGNDVIQAKDKGKGEKIDCGPGRDTVVADKGDKPAKNCERVKFA